MKLRFFALVTGALLMLVLSVTAPGTSMLVIATCCVLSAAAAVCVAGARTVQWISRRPPMRD